MSKREPLFWCECALMRRERSSASTFPLWLLPWAKRSPGIPVMQVTRYQHLSVDLSEFCGLGSNFYMSQLCSFGGSLCGFGPRSAMWDCTSQIWLLLSKWFRELLEFGLPLLPQACVSELGISQRVRVGLSFYARSPQGFCLKSSTVNVAYFSQKYVS